MSDPAVEPVAVPLPMFPLGSVLFPGMALSLHVFEPRYLQLVGDCLRHGHEFGVVLIERGAEVGGGDLRFGVGTVARIIEAAPFPDGRWLLLCIGTRRIRVLTWLPDDPYPLALVENIFGRVDANGGDPSEAREELAAARADAERAVRRSLAVAGELDEAPVATTFEIDDDPVLAGWQLASAAPLGPVDHQRVLEHDPEADRLRLVAALADDAAALLAFRLACLGGDGEISTG